MSLPSLSAKLDELLSVFKTSQNLSQELSAVKAENGQLTAKLAASESQLADLQSKLSEQSASAASAKAEVEAAATKVASLEAAVATAESKLKEVLENPSKQALEIAAKAGVSPAARPQATGEFVGVSKSRDEFNQMAPRDRAAFLKAGGKLTD